MIELTNIHREFPVGEQRVQALDGVYLNIPAGAYLSIMGPSGSGKSTLLNIIGLLDGATSGSYYLDGEDVTELSDERQALLRQRKIGFIFQSFHLISRLSAAENIELPLVLAGISKTERQDRVQAALAGVGLLDRQHHKPSQLSGGQRQRVAIARATVMQPSMILADEPTGNLDSRSGAEVMATLEALHQSGKTLIIVTHDPNIGARAATHIRMVDGKIIAEGSAAL